MNSCVFCLKVFVCLCIICDKVYSEHYPWGIKTIPKTPNEPQTREILGDVGSPLYLTQYINNGWLKSARQKAKVTPPIGSWLSYAGFFTVNAKCFSNIFFWFIPAKNDRLNAPVVMWLQGGPGSGSLYGLFEEIGPFNHFADGLVERNFTWNTDNNMIYIDQPVGSGYSFTKGNCYAKNMSRVAEELYSATTQFLQLFPELRKNKFFITGESFAGHYIPAFAVHIHRRNQEVQEVKDKINLSGIFMANPLIKLSCHDYASFLYQWGAVTSDLRDQIIQKQISLKRNAQTQNYTNAWVDWNYILNDLVEQQTDIKDKECMLNLPPDQSDYMYWVTNDTVRKQLHVGDAEYNDQSWEVYEKLIDTIAVPMTAELEELLEARNYSIGIFSGNLDLVCLTTSSECVLEGLKWWGSKLYSESKRQPFTIDGNTLAGWVNTAGPLYLVIVKDSGHCVPFYQPQVSLALINAVTKAAPGVNPASLLDTSISLDA